jgi:hypothetical protein
LPRHTSAATETTRYKVLKIHRFWPNAAQATKAQSIQSDLPYVQFPISVPSDPA